MYGRTKHMVYIMRGSEQFVSLEIAGKYSNGLKESTQEALTPYTQSYRLF